MARKRKARKIASTIHNFANERRENRGRSKLHALRPLNRAAENYARKMADAGRLGHHVDGLELTDRYKGYVQPRENCAKLRRVDRPVRVLAGDAIKQWMNSDQHRQNLLTKEGSIDGVGVWIRGDSAFVAHCIAVREQATSTQSLFSRLLK